MEQTIIHTLNQKRISKTSDLTMNLLQVVLQNLGNHVLPDYQQQRKNKYKK